MINGSLKYIPTFQLENNTMKNEALEQQYNNAYAQYIEASQKIVEEMESAQEDESSDEDEEKKENENEERWQAEEKSCS